LADQAAKRASYKASANQKNNLNSTKVPILTKLMISNKIFDQWNKDWVNINTANEHYHCKSIIYSNQEAASMIYHVYPRLDSFQVKTLTRLISGHVQLKYYLFSIGVSNNPYCLHCSTFEDEIEETIHHFFFDCKKFQRERNDLQTQIQEEVPQAGMWPVPLRTLLTGFPNNDLSQRLKIIKLTLNFVSLSKKQV